MVRNFYHQLLSIIIYSLSYGYYEHLVHSYQFNNNNNRHIDISYEKVNNNVNNNNNNNNDNDNNAMNYNIKLNTNVNRLIKYDKYLKSRVEIDIYSMLHIGDKSYYDNILNDIHQYDVILYELITSKDNIITIDTTNTDFTDVDNYNDNYDNSNRKFKKVLKNEVYSQQLDILSLQYNLTHQLNEFNQYHLGNHHHQQQQQQQQRRRQRQIRIDMMNMDSYHGNDNDNDYNDNKSNYDVKGIRNGIRNNYNNNNWYIADLTSEKINKLENKNKFQISLNYLLNLLFGRNFNQQLMKKSLFSDRYLISLLRIFIWFIPCPELSCLLIDWSRMPSPLYAG